MIPFNSAPVIGRELDYVREAAASGHTAGDGPFTKRCERLLADALGAPRVLLTTSCTHALEMGAMLLELGPGDEVIVPSFTFVSTVNPIVLRGATPVFADIRPDTLNIDEHRLPDLVTPRTKAIFVVHYAGVACEMDAILAVAARHGIPVLEDTAHALFGRYHGRQLGTLGSLGTLSFHETKNFTCGEGGALVITDARLVERAEILREKGTNRSRFFRGQIDKYTWVDVGSSYIPSELVAAYLLAQLEMREEVQTRRAATFARYANTLASWAAEQGIRLPVIPDGCDSAFHMFYLQFPGLEPRDRFITHMKAAGVHCVFHYLPLHRSPMGEHWNRLPADTVTERASDGLVRLPFYTTLSDADQAHVIASATAFRI